MMYPKRSIRSFVHRDGRMTKGQKQAFETLWTHYGVAISSEKPLDFSAWFNQQQPDKLIVEIGFGMGHSLLNMAEQFPACHFLGIEVYRKGLGAVLNAIHHRELNNVRLIAEDALTVLKHIPDHALDAILIFFPDPWPKKRHHKRRLIQTDFIELISQKLKSGGYLHIATDWKDYAEHIAAVLAQFPHLVDYSDQNIVLPRTVTKFEQRGRKLGHEVYEFIKIL